MTSLDDAKVFAKMALANKLAEAMERKSINRTELAVKLNKSKPFVTKIMKGDANLTIETIVEVMHALDAMYIGVSAPISLDEWAVYSDLMKVEDRLWSGVASKDEGGEPYLSIPDDDDNIISGSFYAREEKVYTNDSSPCAA